MAERAQPAFNRRHMLAGGVLGIAAMPAIDHAARITSGAAPADTPSPPKADAREAWQFFTPAEAETVKALADTLIPPDPIVPGGKDAGCAVFLDRRLAGAYGNARDMYARGPFTAGATPEQGYQFSETPAALYRHVIADLDALCRRDFGGAAFANLDADQRQETVYRFEAGDFQLAGHKSSEIFEILLADIMQGFFADPIYGGNRGMVSWRMIGFPGARYDYRDQITAYGQRYPLAPVGLDGTIAARAAVGRQA